MCDRLSGSEYVYDSVYLVPSDFGAPLIFAHFACAKIRGSRFAQQGCAKIKGERKAFQGARKLKGARISKGVKKTRLHEWTGQFHL